MKKILIILSILLLCSSLLFAEEVTTNFYEAEPAAYEGLSMGFKPNNAEMLGLGGAGLALMDSEFGIFNNPASLAEGKFRLSLPSVGITVYHVYDMVKKDEKTGKSFIETAASAQDSDTSALVNQLLNIIGTSYAPLVKVDVATSMILPFGLGLGVYATDTVATYSGSVIEEVSAVAALGFAYKAELGPLALSLGANAKFNALAFTKRIGATELTSMMSSDSNINDFKLSIASGWAPLADFGATLSIKNLSVGVTYSDVNFTGYKMDVSDTTIGDISNNYMSYLNLNQNAFVIKTKASLNAGVAYEFDTSVLDLKIACDVKDILGLFDDSRAVDARKFVSHLNAGVELGLLDTVIARGGFNNGYFTLGASFDIFIFRVDAAYFWQEMGTAAGQKGLDGLTIRFNVGYER